MRLDCMHPVMLMVLTLCSLNHPSPLKQTTMAKSKKSATKKAETPTKAVAPKKAAVQEQASEAPEQPLQSTPPQKPVSLMETTMAKANSEGNPSGDALAAKDGKVVPLHKDNPKAEGDTDSGDDAE